MIRQAVAVVIAATVTLWAQPLGASRASERSERQRATDRLASARRRASALERDAITSASQAMSHISATLQPYAAMLGIRRDSIARLRYGQPFPVFFVTPLNLRRFTGSAADTLLSDSHLMDVGVLRDGTPRASVELRHHVTGDSVVLVAGSEYAGELETLRARDSPANHGAASYFEVLAYECRMLGYRTADGPVAVYPTRACATLRTRGAPMSLDDALRRLRNALVTRNKQ